MMNCPICGKVVDIGIEYGDADVYHLECIKYAPMMVETRKFVQSAFPDKVAKNGQDVCN